MRKIPSTGIQTHVLTCQKVSRLLLSYRGNRLNETLLLRVFVDVVSRHEVFVRFRFCSSLAHDEGGDIGGDAGQTSGEPRDILRDVDDVTTMRILPSLEAVDAHDGGDLGDEHLLNLRNSLQLWGCVSRVHVAVGGEGCIVLSSFDGLIVPDSARACVL